MHPPMNISSSKERPLTKSIVNPAGIYLFKDNRNTRKMCEIKNEFKVNNKDNNLLTVKTITLFQFLAFLDGWH